MTENEKKVYGILMKNTFEDLNTLLLSKHSFEKIAKQIVESLSLSGVSGSCQYCGSVKELKACQDCAEQDDWNCI